MTTAIFEASTASGIGAIHTSKGPRLTLALESSVSGEHELKKIDVGPGVQVTLLRVTGTVTPVWRHSLSGWLPFKDSAGSNIIYTIAAGTAITAHVIEG